MCRLKPKQASHLTYAFATAGLRLNGGAAKKLLAIASRPQTYTTTSGENRKTRTAVAAVCYATSAIWRHRNRRMAWLMAESVVASAAIIA